MEMKNDDYIPKIGDKVKMKKETGNIVAPLKKDLHGIPPFVVEWSNGDREDWTYNPGDFFSMGGKIIK
jgi:hypothetical protein